MVDARLQQYVQGLLAQGYTKANIRQLLEKKGYSFDQIDPVLGRKLSPAILLLAGAIIVGLAAIGFFLLDREEQPATIDLTLTVQTPSVEASQPITFQTIIEQTGKDPITVVLTTEVLDQSGKLIVSDEQSVSVSESTPTTGALTIPASTPSGQYVVRSTARYLGNKQVKTAALNVQGVAASCTDGIQNQDETGVDCGGSCPACAAQEVVCEDNDACTTDQVISGVCIHQAIIPCCGNGVCEQGETCTEDCGSEQPRAPGEQTPAGIKTSSSLDDIKIIASTDPQRAANECEGQTISSYKDSCYSNVASIAHDESFCQSILNERIKDVCFSEVAKNALRSETCRLISKEDRRDSCYLTFVLDYKDYSVCDLIVNKNLKQSCVALRNLG